ncbi:hypothetical protein H4219_002469 [Mycoemilia scoparia]|uniref:Uncharacterized protein n=1 Tax=Mycoemilia scoparia TaxID=417184 RepID=A0A9W8A3Z1_9FUNG|nr:hypothetical protein H4219_002469 [Mycoemilia scoparia]
MFSIISLLINNEQFIGKLGETSLRALLFFYILSMSTFIFAMTAIALHLHLTVVFRKQRWARRLCPWYELGVWVIGIILAHPAFYAFKVVIRKNKVEDFMVLDESDEDFLMKSGAIYSFQAVGLLYCFAVIVIVWFTLYPIFKPSAAGRHRGRQGTSSNAAVRSRKLVIPEGDTLNSYKTETLLSPDDLRVDQSFSQRTTNYATDGNNSRDYYNQSGGDSGGDNSRWQIHRENISADLNSDGGASSTINVYSKEDDSTRNNRRGMHSSPNRSNTDWNNVGLESRSRNHTVQGYQETTNNHYSQRRSFDMSNSRPNLANGDCEEREQESEADKKIKFAILRIAFCPIIPILTCWVLPAAIVAPSRFTSYSDIGGTLMCCQSILCHVALLINPMLDSFWAGLVKLKKQRLSKTSNIPPENPPPLDTN